MGIGVQWKWGVFVTLVAILQACGGGGGGGGAPTRDTSGAGKSPAQLLEIYTALREDAYTGSTEPAVLSSKTILPFARAVLSDEFPQAPVASASTRKALHNATSIVRKPALKSLRGGETLSEGVALKERVDVQQPCENEEGSSHLTGDLNENGVGALDVFYSNCLSNGVLVNGNAVVYINEFQQTEYFFYDHFELTVDDVKVIMTGSVRFHFSDGTMESNAVLTNTQTNYQYQMVDYYENSNGDLISGRSFLPTLGWMDLLGSYYLDELQTEASGTLELVMGNSSALITLETENPKVEFTDSATADNPSVAYLPLSELLQYDNDYVLTLIPLSQMGSPPTYSYINFPSYNATVLEPIEFTVMNVTDPDGDEVQISYHWFVNYVELPDQHSSILPAGIAKGGEEVRVYAVLSDGKNTVYTGSSWLTVNDSQPMVTATDTLPSSIAVGDALEFSVVYSDPDSPGVSLGAVELAYGPDGASLDNNGVFRWSASSLLFGSEQIFHFGFRHKGTTDAPSDIQVTVKDADAARPLVRSGSQVPDLNNAIQVIQFDDDAEKEILVSDSFSLVYTLQKQGDDYVQDWVYPFSLGTAGRVVQARAFDVNGDGKDELFVATEKEIFYIASKDSVAESRYTYSDNQFEHSVIKSIDVADLDRDGKAELVLLIANPYYDDGHTVEVIDAKTGTMRYSISLPNDANSMAIGNVDADESLEIILSSGLVYDGSSATNEWYNSESFGDFVAAGDMDADGKDEILAAFISGKISVIDAVSKQKLSSVDEHYTCSLAAGNIDADLQQELIAGDCQWGKISAYDAADSALVLQWYMPAIASGTRSLVVADADNDQVNEVVWASGRNYYGDGSLAVAETDLQSNVWTGSHWSSIVGAGWATIAPGDSRAVFVVPNTDGGNKGQRVVLMSEQGDLEQSEVLSENWEGGDVGAIGDYNNDGIDEIFLASAQYDSEFVQVMKLNDFSQVWKTTSRDSSSDVRVVQSADVNNDGFNDLVYADAELVVMVDLQSETIIATLNSDKKTVNDVAVFDLDNDLTPEIIVATTGELAVWKKVGVTYSKTKSTSDICSRIVVGKFDTALAVKIACSSGYYYDSGMLNFYDASLGSKKSYSKVNAITDMAAIDLGDGHVSLMVAETIVGLNYDDPERSVVGKVSAETGNMVWSSPQLLGVVPKFSLHSFVDETNKTRLTFSTNNAMYISP